MTDAELTEIRGRIDRCRVGGAAAQFAEDLADELDDAWQLLAEYQAGVR
jgi:hypothetical protein